MGSWHFQQVCKKLHDSSFIILKLSVREVDGMIKRWYTEVKLSYKESACDISLKALQLA